jgi:hypothetical protein
MREAQYRSALRFHFIPVILPDKPDPLYITTGRIRGSSVLAKKWSGIWTPTTNPTISVAPIRVICDLTERRRVAARHLRNVGGCLLSNVPRD